MDVPLALNDIGIRYGFKGYKRKSSTFSHKAVVEGFSVFLAVSNDRNGMIVDLFEIRRVITSLFCCPIMIDSNA